MSSEEQTLKDIEEWDYTDFDGLMEFVGECVAEYGRLWTKGGKIHLATGGWSWNEEVVEALKKNQMFWSLYWDSSHRGGLFVFRKPERPVDPKLLKAVRKGFAEAAKVRKWSKKVLADGRKRAMGVKP